MKLKRGPHIKIVHVILDLIFVFFSLFISSFIIFGTSPSHKMVAGFTFLSVICLYFFGIYGKKEHSTKESLFHILKAVSLTTLFLIVLFYYRLNYNLYFSELLFLFIFGLSSFSLIAGWRITFDKIESREPFTKKILIIGVGNHENSVVDKLKNNDKFKVVGFVANTNKKSVNRMPVLGRLSDVRKIIRENYVDEIVFANPRLPHNLILKIIDLCRGTHVKFKTIPSLYETIVEDVVEQKIKYFPLLELVTEPIPLHDRVIKRVIDMFGSLASLIFLSPFFLIVAITIKLDSRGPVFYHQERLGRNGKPFIMHKFRTMIPDAERGIGPIWAKKHDPRETRVGRFLRSRSFDELPNLVNVLNGSMTFVGPRAERPFFSKKFEKYVKHWNERLEIKPGLTGLAEVHGDYDLKPRQKLKYDMEYINNFSFWLDFKILFQTLLMELFKKREY